jgi:transposase
MCLWVGDSDHNGALNIASLAGMVVNPSESSTMFCSLQDVVRAKAPSF